jgi:2-dehydropantoate 2-reductase
MKFAILGSGAVGGYYGAKLATGGHDVTFIARGAHLQAIRDKGLEVRSVLGDMLVKAPAEEDTTRVGPVDCVIVATKNYDNGTALPGLTPMLGPLTRVLTLQNGVDSIDDCAAVAGRDKVLGGCCYVATALEAPGLIVQTGTHRRVIFGEVFNLPSGNGAGIEVSPRVEQLRQTMAASDIQVEVVGDARVPLWEKFIYLAPFAGFTGAARTPIGGIWPQVKDVFLDACREVERVAAAEGVRVTDSLWETLEKYLMGLPPSTRSSLLIDLQQGKRIEVEALQGSVVRRGKKAGVPTPILSALYSVLKPYENGPLDSRRN